jgi:hypothetical protein
VKPVPPTAPGSLALEPCRWCAGHGFEPTEENGLIPCLNCGGGSFEPVAFDLGSTRSYPHGRPANYNPGLRRLVVTRGRQVEVYELAELPCDNGFPGRGFQVVKVGTGEIRDCFLAHRGDDNLCDCEGFTYESSARANQRAHDAGGPIFPTLGCLHLDALKLLLGAGLLDLPLNPDHLATDEEVAAAAKAAGFDAPPF